MQGFISYDDLVNAYNVSENTVKCACRNFRNGISKSWLNIRDNDDKRRVWIKIDTIPTKTREKYNIPTAAEYEAQKEALLQKALELENKVKHNKDTKNLLNAYQGKWSQYSETYHKRLEYSTKQQEKYAIRYAQEHAFWVQMIEVSGGKYKASYGKISECFNMYCTLKQKHINFISEIKSCNHFRVKLKAIREANLKGIQYMVDEIVDNGKKARPNQIKVNDFHTSLMVMYLSYGQKYSYRVVTDLINHLCEFQGFETISESSVKSKMYNDNKLRTIIEKNRHGKKYASDNILPYAVRNVTPFPGNVWMIDGTPIQFICWNESRTKQIRLNLFVIIDVCSRKVVGMDISYSEDRYNIMNALKMAISNEGHLPYEIDIGQFFCIKDRRNQRIKATNGQTGCKLATLKSG